MKMSSRKKQQSIIIDMNKEEILDQDPDKLELIRIKLQDCMDYRLSNNPKGHDLQKIAQSILRYGFVDPGKLDRSSGAFVFGNGRVEALSWLYNEGIDPPRGIEVDEEGNWLVPVLVGIDAEDESEALALSLDHNMLTVLGGDGVTHLEASRMYDQQEYLNLLKEVAIKSKPVTADDEDIELLEEVLRRQQDEPLVFDDDEDDYTSQENYSVNIFFDTLESKQKFVELLKQHSEAEAIPDRGELLLHLLS